MVVRKKIKELDDGDTNCDFTNIQIKVGFSTENEARKWLNDHVVRIFSKYTMHTFKN